MANSKKKRSLSLIILLIAMLVLIGAWFLLVKYKDKDETTDTDNSTKESTTILSLDSDSITTIYYHNESGEMTLVKDDEGVWKNSLDENFPVNQTYANNMKTALTNVTSSRTITDVTEGLVSFGLDSPSIQIEVTASDGTKSGIAIGDEVPLSGGYYATLNDSNDIYVVPKSLYDPFAYNLVEMTAVEEIPSITKENITHLKVENKEKSNFEVAYDADTNADYSGMTHWTMKQPYPTDIPADGDSISNVLTNYTDMKFDTCVEYNASDLSLYGLDNPSSSIYLEYYEEFTQNTDDKTSEDKSTGTALNTSESKSMNKADSADDTSSEDTANDKDKKPITTTINYTLELLIGSSDGNGSYYVKLKDSNAVYTMTESTIAKLTEIDAYSNAYHYVNLINIDTVDKLDVTIDDAAYTMVLTRKTETVDDKEKEVTKYTFNGEDAKEDAFKDLYQTIIGTTTEREIPADYRKDSSASPVMTFTYYLNDRPNPIVIKYLPYDDSYYVVNSNGNEYFLTDRRKVDEVADAIQNFNK